MSDDKPPTPTAPPLLDDEDSLPTKVVIPPKPSIFGPAVIDYTVSQKLKDLIPSEANSATVTVKIKGRDGEKIITGVVATRIGDGFGLALAGALNLADHRDFEIEFLGVINWK